jgi:L-rhamnose 1-dehydrogenase
MVKQGHGGSIIGVSSVSALQGGGMQTHYTPTKAGVLSLMQSMSIALGKHNIRCNALMPGTVRTQLSEKEIENEVTRKRLESKIPLGRAGEPWEMGGPAVFLACPEMSSFVTGAGLLADGGMYSYMQ